MISFKQFLAESFDKPLSWKWYTINDSYATAGFNTSDGDEYVVNFENHGNDNWWVEFINESVGHEKQNI